MSDFPRRSDAKRQQTDETGKDKLMEVRKRQVDAKEGKAMQIRKTQSMEIRRTQRIDESRDRPD